MSSKLDFPTLQTQNEVSLVHNLSISWKVDLKNNGLKKSQDNKCGLDNKAKFLFQKLCQSSMPRTRWNPTPAYYLINYYLTSIIATFTKSLVATITQLCQVQTYPVMIPTSIGLATYFVCYRSDIIRVQYTVCAYCTPPVRISSSARALIWIDSFICY